MTTGRNLMASSMGASNLDGLASGGNTGTAYTAATEEWNGATPVGAWTTGTDMNTARKNGGATDIGDADSSMKIAGEDAGGTKVANTEIWNGTSWTEVNDVNTARENLPGSGSTTAGLVFGGYTTTPQAVTENWNGSSWTEVADLNRAV